MASEQGWIKLYRSSFNNNLYFQEAFTRWQAWCDLLLLANHKDGCYRVRGIEVCVKRGQVGFSSDGLAERWKWSRGKVLRFLADLEKDQQIVQQKSKVTSLLSIVNYSKYQHDGTTNGTTENLGDFSSINGTTKRSQNGTTENEKSVQQTVQQKKDVTLPLSEVLVSFCDCSDTTDDTTEYEKTVQQTVQQNGHKQENKESKEEESNKITAGGYSPPAPPQSVPGFNYLSDGRSYIEPTVFFRREQFNGLPVDNVKAVKSFFSTTKDIDVSTEKVEALWDIFKIQELTDQKPYRNKEDVYRHFLNWSKKQPFSKPPRQREPVKKKSSAEAAPQKTNLNLQIVANRYD